MEVKIIKMKNNEQFNILSDNNSAVVLKKQNNRIKVSELYRPFKQNIYIQNINIEELISFILIHLLENNISENLKDNHKLINEIMNNHYKYFCGEDMSADDIKKIEYQVITYLN